MLNKFNDHTKTIVKQILNFRSFLTAKAILYFGLVAYWLVILFGTFFNL